ncbi:MAG: zinc-ribbon domain-containing protein [Candidatus Aminicenantes bacterium]|nr:zinc-ribbon domain-containing protein [Candidatus Aminicenantes bacterium]
MIIQCPKCGKKYKFDESKFGPDERAKKVRCKKCGTVFEVLNPFYEESTADKTVEDVGVGKSVTEDEEPTTRERLIKTDQEPHLPEDKEYVLYITKGAKQGFKYKIEKPVIVLGRFNVDFVIPDRQVSRKHAAIEIYGDRVIIKDLRSTNGTFVNGERVFQAELEDQSEIVLGGTTLLFLKLRKEADAF